VLFRSREPFQLHIWFSDERFTSLEDNERTDTKLINAFEKNVDNPRISIIFHRVSSPEVLSLTEAANAYAAELDDLLTGSNFDAVLLSMGEDGHIASLFPGLSTTAHSTKSAVPVDNSPKPPAQRVSIGVDRLAAASAIYIFALGEGKREALTNFEQRSQGPVSLLVEAGRFGQMFIVTDQKI
jgi:6-phosphogluconolactonase